jgi:hypothetical protein
VTHVGNECTQLANEATTLKRTKGSKTNARKTHTPLQFGQCIINANHQLKIEREDAVNDIAH